MHCLQHTAAHSRADYNHQAVAEGSNPDHEIGEGKPELQEANGPLVVVKSIEKDGIFAITLQEEYVQGYYLLFLYSSLIGVFL